VDEPRAKIEAGEQIVLAAKVDAVMAVLTQKPRPLAGDSKNNIFHRAETSIGENAAVGICDRQLRAQQSATPENATHCNRLGKMSGVRRCSEIQAKILHSGFRDVGSKRGFVDAIAV